MNASKDVQQVTFPAAIHDNDKYDDMIPSRRYCCYYSNDYMIGLLIRISILISIVGILIGMGIGLRYTSGLPRSEDFSKLKFDWKLTPGDDLIPFNKTFKYNVLLDGHTHSIYSDGKMNIRQLLNWHIANGYNAIIVTDHNTVNGGLAAEHIALKEYNQSIIVIPGMEYTCCRIHMNFININETIRATSPTPSDEELQRVIKKVHTLGGLVIVNHIAWSNTTQAGYQTSRLPNHPTIDQLIRWGVDGFEVINQGTFDLPTYQQILHRPLIQMTGTDVHHPSMSAQVWLTLNAANLTKASIMEEIRQRRTSFLFDPSGSRPRAYPASSPTFKRVLPLTQLGEYFNMFYSSNKGMYSFQGSFCHPEVFQVNKDVVAWFLVWMMVSVVVFEVVRYTVLSGLRRYRRVTADLV